MTQQLMVLPCSVFDKIRVVRIPPDLEAHEAFRFATGIIAKAEEENQECAWDVIADALEERGFEQIDALIGPALD